MTRKLPWPANTVERDVARQLSAEAKATGVPISHVVKAAIDDYLNRRLDEAHPSSFAPSVAVSAQAA